MSGVKSCTVKTEKVVTITFTKEEVEFILTDLALRKVRSRKKDVHAEVKFNNEVGGVQFETIDSASVTIRIQSQRGESPAL